MNVVIDQGGVKRQLEGPFALCASSEHMKVIRERLTEFIESGSSYGWVDIYEAPKVERSTNTKPMPWK